MRQPSPKRLASSIGLAIGLALIVSPVAHAVSSAGFTAYPTGKATSASPYFIYALAGGQTQADSLTVVNTTNRQQTVRLYAVDAVKTDGNGFGLLPEASPRQDVGSWINLQANSLTLAAHAKQTVAFTIQVPSQVALGEHLGGIIIQPTTATTTYATNGTTLTIVPRLGVRIYETVPGKAEAKLKLSPLAIQRQGTIVTVTSRLINEGNTLLSPTGTITLTNTLGQLIDSQQLPAGQVFRPGETLTVRRVFTLPKQSIQRYGFSESVQYAPTKSVQARGSLWVQWQILLVPGGLLGGILAYSVYRRKKKLKI